MSRETYYCVEVSMEEFSKAIGASYPTRDRCIDEDDYNESLDNFYDTVNWHFEKIQIGFSPDMKKVAIVFKRNEYENEPEDIDEYFKFLKKMIYS